VNASAIGTLCRLLFPPRRIRANVRDITFRIPGQEGGDVTDLDQLADVLVINDGDLVLRNCHIRGAVSLRICPREGVLLIRGMAGSAIQYEPPS
jgi:hypothetical protein